MKRLGRRAFLSATLAAPAAAVAQTPGHPLLATPWPDVVAAARGQTVFWNAWGGDDRTNGFIAWANDRVSERYGVRIQHVRLRDTAEAVARVVAEKSAGREQGGSVDLVWINGPNFLAMKEAGLLFGPFVHRLPNARFIDTEGKPATVTDFTVPVEGLAAPWRMAQIVFVYNSATVRDPPRSIPAMLAWARANPGRLTHPTARTSSAPPSSNRLSMSSRPIPPCCSHLPPTRPSPRQLRRSGRGTTRSARICGAADGSSPTTGRRSAR